MKMCLAFIFILVAVLIPVIVTGTSTGPGAFGGGFEVVDCAGVTPPLGDLNGDCKIDYSDIVIIAENWLLEGTAA